MLHEIAQTIVGYVGDMGYWGIFLLMFLESTFFPFPSEIVMIPAGYLAYKGEMNLYLAVLAGIVGSIAGALFNYYLALHFGRKFILKYGRYFFISEKTLNKLELFFKNHGELSTFNGRLIPGIRQLISLPAGLARMNIPKFIFYSGFGAGIWVIVLVALGYFLGANEALIAEYLQSATLIALVCVVLITVFYIVRYKRKKAILED
ncbi:MAG TPA: DedA family protein [Sulfurovum sp.]|jgi:membrane protein DedA with SNARE-associated domain|nr:MAG: DedA family protein [Sulfurovum sp. 35-42-20]OYZ26885.1 MAG: DedA family protein [Sulfurovum sp. 16-42-52]OYZ49544.1 MAG: DedA family protein [Sulfurovum sp. 24-42-9]OZA45884.1 MAG: DedA family protein [Sulfurovum sp. 17-42-90]OZA59890.1 MAG: DedA family protein [Sulfurovum sp. 39-42-12]HQR73159.1 DedA family protein [Sulfurovum sp.]